MNKRLELFLLIILAALSAVLWSRLSLPRYQAINLSISQPKAVTIAKEFLTKQRKIDIQGYKTVVSFNVDEDTDRYLQKTLGISASQQLVNRLHYDLFFWVVRFFKKKNKKKSSGLLSVPRQER